MAVGLALAVLIVGYLVVFASAAVSEFLPMSLALPLSDIDDFTQAADGTILLYSSFYNRLLRYSQRGEYRGSSYLLPARGLARLAAARDGTVWLFRAGQLCHVQGDSLSAIDCRFSPLRPGECLILPEEGRLPVVSSTNDAVSRSTLGGLAWPGDLLFCGPDIDAAVSRRRQKLGARPTLHLRFERNGLTLHDSGASARESRIRAAWYLWWAHAPFPLLAIGIGLMVTGVALDLLSRRRGRTRAKHNRE